MAETLVAIARALFKSWFIDFDPVYAKAKGRPTGLSDELAALFPSRFDGDGLPAGWRIEPVSSLFDISGGNTPRTENPNFWGGCHRWATPKDLSGLASPVLLQTARQLTDAGLQQTSSGLMPAGSLLLSTRAPIGYLAFVTSPTAINQGFAGFKHKETSTAYAWAWCQFNMDLIVGNANGSTFQEISKSVLRQLPMLAPSRPVLDAFGQAADALVERVVSTVKETKTLSDIRDTLLPKLISGELRIADAEKQIAVA
jgi:type I restriction enzyme S subunit